MRIKSITSVIVASAIALAASQTTILAQETPTTPTAKLAVGSEIPKIDGFTWLKGEPVQSLDKKGKVYMLELWATWCGPCIQIIPHVNELHNKYKDLGFTVIGVNVFEDDLDTVKAFVEKQGDGMSYRVAYSGGEGSHFEKNWIQPAGIQGIPHALIIKDGKIIFSDHPATLQESTIEAMLKPDFDAEKHAAEAAAAQKAQQELQNKFMPLFQKEDWDGILELANTLEDSNPSKIELIAIATLRKGNWIELTELRKKLSGNKDTADMASLLDTSAAFEVATAEGAKEYALAALSSPLNEEMEVTPFDHLAKARFSTLAGKKDEAVKNFEKFKTSLSTMEDSPLKNELENAVPVITKEMESGKFPSIQELVEPK